MKTKKRRSQQVWFPVAVMMMAFGFLAGAIVSNPSILDALKGLGIIE